MDADYSHHPRFLAPMFVRAGVIIGNEGEKPEQTADIVVGSRLIAGGGEEGRNLARTIITWGANIYLRLLLRLPIRDCTTGYRLFSGDMLRRYNWSAFESNGPAIVQELLLAGQALGARMVEVPILFEPRREGESTFNLKIALAGLVRPLRMRLRGGRILVQTDK
jgi:dolichol-phosphate mannosyltransferase